MKKFLGLALILCISLFSFAIKEVDAREAFDIRFHTVEMEVHDDGAIVVTETMGVHFTEQRHGIYVDIPKKYNMTWQIGSQTREKTYTFPVTGMAVLSSHKYEVEENSTYVRIKIGSSSYYANEDETYKWTYVIHTKDLGLDGMQMVFMNVIKPYGWNTDTEKCDFIITMPKSFDPENIAVASPEGMTYGTGRNGHLNIEVVGNVIKGSYDAVLTNSEGITIQVLLDEGYFEFEDVNKAGTLSVILASVLSVLSVFVFLRFGKDDPLIPTVEFHAPEGLNSAEVGTIIDEEANDDDIVSLILDWGRRGLITIEETENDLLLRALPEAEESLKGYEKNFFEGVFRGKEKRYVSTMKNTFYKKVERCREDINQKFRNKAHNLITRSSSVAQAMMVPLCAVPVCLTLILCWRKVYFEVAPMLFLSVFVLVATVIGTALVCYYVKKTYINKLFIKILLIIGAIIFFAVPTVALTLVLEICNIKPIYTVIILGITLLMVILTAFMKKRTAYGNEMLGKVIGLKEFIRVAEEDKLRTLQEEDPMYFYNILPYAYAFGLTNIWNDHFKNIEIPDCRYYTSYSPYSDRYHMVHSLNSNMHTVSTAMNSRPVESSGGSGFSSGGGGGSSFSSGGGFGGSSGGSW
ncbi:MAG: DUF2207 domain-containing protein [Erysipelotrichaceae bacterium]|nr:DUF2207 domain-containing protein [Erysipelotrichaceae bacterium]